MSVIRSVTPQFATNATRSSHHRIPATLAVLAGLAVPALTFGFAAHADPVAPTARHLVAGNRTSTAAQQQIIRLEKRGYTQAACTKHGTLMLNRHTNQTRMINL